MKIKRLLFNIAAAFAAASSAKATELPIETSDSVGTGFWMGKFADATNLAQKASAPMVLFWANEGCTECERLEEAVNSAEFKAWQAEHSDYIYCYIQGKGGKDVDPNENSGAFTFARTAAETIPATKALTKYPFICLYWPQANGSVKATAFVGRDGMMTVKTAGLPLVEQFGQSIVRQFSGYEVASVDFRCGDSAGTIGLANRNDRLEAEPSTPVVRVPLARSGAIAGTTVSSLVVEWPDGIKPVETNTFVWAPLETNRFVSIDMSLPDGVGFPESGKRIELLLLDVSMRVVASNGITFVGPKANACTNPYWLGERTADTLGFAEWTHDYNIVREKVLGGGADYTLALFSGTMWCPYCHGIDDSFLVTDIFREWCESNRVQVALFDQAQLPANGGGSQLLSYVKSVEHIFNTDVVTGASYLSRHGLADTDEDVVAVRERTALYSTSKWLAPEATAVRLSNPTVLLIDRNDNVVGRFSAWRDRGLAYSNETFGAKYYEPTENIGRLNDLLKLADRRSEAQDYASTTTNEMEIGGHVVSTLQCNDAKDHFLLKLPSRGRAVFSVAGKTADRQVRLAIVRDGTEIAYSTSGTLEVEFTRADIAAKRLVLRVTAPELSGTMRFNGESSVFNATITNMFEAVTADSGHVYSDFTTKTPLSSYVVAKGQKVAIKITGGKLPKGLSLAWDAATSSVIIKGKTTATGTFNFTYKVTVKNSTGKKVISTESTRAVLTVASPKTVNPFYATAFTTSVPLYVTDEWGVTTLSSAIQVVQTTKKGLSAKRFNGGTTSFSGKWTKFDQESGLLSSSIKSGKVTLKASLTLDGLLTVSIGATSGAVSIASGYARFAGAYTVSMPVAESTAWYYTFGAGYLTLKSGTMNAGKGTVTYAGALPNGVAVSGSAFLGVDPEDADYALLPIYKRSTRKLSDGKKKVTAKDDLAAVLRIRANGELLYDDSEKVRVVLSPTGVKSTWKRTTGAQENALVATMDVFGGYYVPGKELSDWLAIFGLGTEDSLVVTVDGEEVQATWNFNKATGVLTGKAKTKIDRRTVIASFKGVVTPGWLDCGCGDEEQVVRPFATGTFFYSSRVNGFSTPSSLEFNLVAP